MRAAPWHKLHIVGKCDYDDGYNQDLVLWVQARSREAAVAKAMIDNHLISDATLSLVEILASQETQPEDWNIIRDKDRD